MKISRKDSYLQGDKPEVEVFTHQVTSDHWTDPFRNYAFVQKIAKTAVKINQIKQSYCGQMVCSLSSEAIGAYVGKSIANYSIKKCSDRAIDWISARELFATAAICASSYLYFKSSSKAAALGLFFLTPMLLIPDVEGYVRESFYDLAFLVTGIAGSILGGFVGLNCMGHPKTFENYKRKMIKYEITGVLFDSIIINPTSLPTALLFKIPRQLSRSIFQCSAYNSNLIKRGIGVILRKKEPRLLIALATKCLEKKLNQCNTSKHVSHKITEKIFPFLSSNGLSVFARNITEPIVDKFAQAISLNTPMFSKIMIASFLQYTNIIHKSPEIQAIQNHFYHQFFENQSIDDAKVQLQFAIHHEMLQKKQIPSYLMNTIGKNVIWNEQNLHGLIKVMIQFLRDFETDLIGYKLMQEIQWKYIETVLEIHIKNFLKLTFSNFHLGQIPITPDADLQFSLEIKNLIFSFLCYQFLSESTATKLHHLSSNILIKLNHFLEKLKRNEPETRIYASIEIRNSDHFVPMKPENEPFVFLNFS